MAINGQSGLDNYRIGLFVLCLMFSRSKMDQDCQDLGIATYWLHRTLINESRNVDVQLGVDLYQESVNQLKLFCD